MWTEWTHNCEATSKSRLVTDAVLSAEWPDGGWCAGHMKVDPKGPPSPPLLTSPSPEPGLRQGKWTCSLPLACCVGHSTPPNIYPFSLQWMVPKCQHVPPGLSHACPFCHRGTNVTRCAKSTHPWLKHRGPRTAAGCLGTDNTVHHAKWWTESQHNENHRAVIGKYNFILKDNSYYHTKGVQKHAV